jgi:hydrogenase maturation factor HypF (carbamoyltransferase family)
MELTVRIIYHLEGVVKGLEFCSAISRMASDAGIGGSIWDNSDVVQLTLEGTPIQIGSFISTIHHKLPPPAKINDIKFVSKKNIEPYCINEFRIIENCGSNDSGV